MACINFLDKRKQYCQKHSFVNLQLIHILSLGDGKEIYLGCLRGPSPYYSLRTQERYNFTK